MRQPLVRKLSASLAQLPFRKRFQRQLPDVVSTAAPRGSGEAHQAVGDRQVAYERYREAAELPLEDTALAQARAKAIAPKAMLTPTPMAEPLSAYHDRIAFFSDDEERPGRWICAVAKRLDGEGFLITTYPTEAIKEGEQVWSK